MGYEQIDVVFKVLSTLMLLADLMVVLAALGVAIYCTVKKRWVLPAWVFAGANSVAFVFSFVNYVLGMASQSAYDLLGPNGVDLAFDVLSVALLLFYALATVGLALFNASPGANPSGREDLHV